MAFVVLALAVLTAADLRAAYTSLRSARDRLTTAAHDPEGIASPAGRRALAAQIDAAVGDANRARQRISRSPVLIAADVIPGLTTQRRGLLRLTNDVAAGATVGRRLLVRADALAGQTELRDGAVPLDGLRQLDGEVRNAASRLAALARGEGGLWPPLGTARRRFDAAALEGSSRLQRGAETLRAVLSFMGSDGPRRYLIALQNNAEMRNQGAVLSYALARFDKGRVEFERSGSIHEFTLQQPAPTPVPPGTQEVFGFINPTQQWLSVNATADFGFSGRAMVDMFAQATGESIDGVVAIDVPGLAALLRSVGPVTVDGIPEPIDADNVARILLHDLYEGLEATSDQTVRREKLAEVTQAVIARLTTGSQPAVTLGRELGKAAAGGHLRLFSTEGGEQAVFESSGLGGGPATTMADRTFHVAVQNRTPTKLDYYVKPSVSQTVRLDKSGAARVVTRVTVRNEAPVGAAPSYALGPNGENQSAPGDYLAWVMLWAPAGSTEQQQPVIESGLRFSSRQIPVAAGETREVEFETVIPSAVRDGRLALRLVPQPRLEPVPLEVRLVPGDRKVEGSLIWRGPWDATRTLSWEIG